MHTTLACSINFHVDEQKTHWEVWNFPACKIYVQLGVLAGIAQTNVNFITHYHIFFISGKPQVRHVPAIPVHAHTYILYMYILYTKKFFVRRKIFTNYFCYLCARNLIDKIFLSSVNDCTEDMATIYSMGKSLISLNISIMKRNKRSTWTCISTHICKLCKGKAFSRKILYMNGSCYMYTYVDAYMHDVHVLCTSISCTCTCM